MNCNKCRKEIDISCKFCPNCGEEQIINKGVIKQENLCTKIEKKGNTKIRNISFIIFRIIIYYVTMAIGYVGIGSAKLTDTTGGLTLILAVTISVYILGAIILNKFIKLEKFSQYMASNGAAYIISIISSYIIIAKYYDLVGIHDDLRMWSFMWLMITGIQIKPIIMITSIIMDRILWKRNKKSLKMN